MILRGYTRNGKISIRHTHAGNRAKSTFEIPVDDIPIAVALWLLSAGIKRGQCYARARIELGGFAVERLFSGYLAESGVLTYPGGTFEDMASGRGYTYLLTGTDPAAGVEITEAVPTNAIWRLISCMAFLVCDATVANRKVEWRVTDGTDIFYKNNDNVNQTASQSRAHILTINQDLRGSDGFAPAFHTPYPDLRLPQGYELVTQTSGLVAGDNWGAPLLFIEEWLQE